MLVSESIAVSQIRRGTSFSARSQRKVLDVVPNKPSGVPPAKRLEWDVRLMSKPKTILRLLCRMTPVE